MTKIRLDSDRLYTIWATSYDSQAKLWGVSEAVSGADNSNHDPRVARNEAGEVVVTWASKYDSLGGAWTGSRPGCLWALCVQARKGICLLRPLFSSLTQGRERSHKRGEVHAN